MKSWIDGLAVEIRVMLCIWFVLLVIFGIAVLFLPDASRATGLAAMFAGISAIIAAFIAYRGATSKADLDRQIDERNRLSFYIKADQMLVLILEQLVFPAADTIRAELNSDPNTLLPIELRKIQYEEPPQIREIWDNLALFNSEMITSFRRLGVAIQNYRREAVEAEKKGHPTTYNGEAAVEISLPRFKNLMALGKRVLTETVVLRTLLSHVIPEKQLDPIRRSRLSFGFKDGELD